MHICYSQQLFILLFISSIIFLNHANKTSFSERSFNLSKNTTISISESNDDNFIGKAVSGLSSFLDAISEQLLPISNTAEGFLEKQTFLRNDGTESNKAVEQKSPDIDVAAGRDYIGGQDTIQTPTDNPARFTAFEEEVSDDDLLPRDTSYEAVDQISSSSILTPRQPSKRRKYHRRRQPWRASDYCRQYDDDQLYDKLEQVGALNQRYMANSPEDAGRNFAHSYDAPPNTVDSMPVTAFDDALDDFSGKQTFECGEYCQELIWKLNDALAKEKNGTPLTWPIRDAFSTDEGEEEESSGLRPETKPCVLGKFIPAGKCVLQGTEIFKDHSKLCSACHGVYVLGKDCFPRFLSAVRCDDMSTSCIFDRIAGMSHGTCRMRTLSFKVLHNKGNNLCQEWLYEYVEVPIACECYMERKSFFLSPTKP